MGSARRISETKSQGMYSPELRCCIGHSLTSPTRMTAVRVADWCEGGNKRREK